MKPSRPSYDFKTTVQFDNALPTLLPVVLEKIQKALDMCGHFFGGDRPRIECEERLHDEAAVHPWQPALWSYEEHTRCCCCDRGLNYKRND